MNAVASGVSSSALSMERVSLGMGPLSFCTFTCCRHIFGDDFLEQCQNVSRCRTSTGAHASDNRSLLRCVAGGLEVADKVLCRTYPEFRSGELKLAAYPVAKPDLVEEQKPLGMTGVDTSRLLERGHRLLDTADIKDRRCDGQKGVISQDQECTAEIVQAGGPIRNDNLNRLYVAPLDYELWKTLNEASPIASRLYEFLLFNFTGLSVLRVNYPKLAQFLPVAVQRYASLAQRQLDSALALIRKHQVINHYRWDTAKDGSPQLIVGAGKAIRSVCGRRTGTSVSAEDEFAEVSVRELRHLRSPAYTLVHRFHAAWGRDRSFRPTKGELNCAAEINDKLGKDECERLLPVVVERMRQHFPSAKTFGASRPYWIDAERESRAGRERSARTAAEKEREDTLTSLAREKDREWAAAKRAAWNALTDQKKAAVEKHILRSYSHLGIKRGSAAFVSLCLHELQSDK